MRDGYGRVLGTWTRSALANRTVELINYDRAAAALPEAGQMFRR